MSIGSTGWYATKVKFEFQYTDYNSYRYPAPISPVYPETEFTQPEPYISDFPEMRSLVRITQIFGPLTALQLRYQYSDLTAEYNQRLYYAQLARDVSDMTNVNFAYHYIEQPGNFTGYMLAVGCRHDQAGWLLAEGSLSYFRNKSSDGNLIHTYSPLLSIRYALNRTTAVVGRWESFWSEGEVASTTTNVYSVYLSRFLPTQTAVHLAARFYDNTAGIESVSPTIEVAQYIRWNLTLRLTYRYSNIQYDEEASAGVVEDDEIRAQSLRAFLMWQLNADLKLHLKLRRYISDQDIRMNTYLLGFEYLL